MLTHEAIWKAIDQLAAETGYSVSGLAKQAGLDPTSFNKSKRMSADGKPRWPSTESISKILAVTGVSMAGFLSYIEDTAPVTEGQMVVVKTNEGDVREGKVVHFSDKDMSISTNGRTQHYSLDQLQWISRIAWAA